MDGAPAPRSPPRVSLGVRERGGPESPDRNPAEASRARVDDGAEAGEDGAAPAEEETKEPDEDERDGGGADAAPLIKWTMVEAEYSPPVTIKYAPRGAMFQGAVLHIPVLEFGATWASATQPFSAMGPQQLRKAVILADATVGRTKGKYTITERFDDSAFQRGPGYVFTYLALDSPVGCEHVADADDEHLSAEEDANDDAEEEDDEGDASGPGGAPARRHSAVAVAVAVARVAAVVAAVAAVEGRQLRRRRRTTTTTPVAWRTTRTRATPKRRRPRAAAATTPI